jgi:heme a synthase
VSTNYAALACSDLPTCHGAWMPEMDFANAFHVIRPLGVGSNGEYLTMEALRAIHWMHRVGALVTVAVVGLFAWRLMQLESGRKAGRMLTALLTLQVCWVYLISGLACLSRWQWRTMVSPRCCLR